jgi:hypothetical protein
MERAIEIFATLQLFALGLSYIVQPRVWIELFLWLQSRGRVGMFVYGLFNLGVGSIIVAFHNVWTGPATVVTVFGWGLVLYKGLLTLVAPQVVLRGFERKRLSPERAWWVVTAGVGMVALSVLFGYVVFSQ